MALNCYYFNVAACIVLFRNMRANFCMLHALTIIR
uniref:Uncharacterized protein n=1 Tax=Arundo donax TaxID=35708 RepID=A0A0A8ZDT3_ARUDO